MCGSVPRRKQGGCAVWVINPSSEQREGEARDRVGQNNGLISHQCTVVCIVVKQQVSMVIICYFTHKSLFFLSFFY